MRWFETADYNFVGNRKIAYVISGILVAASIIALIFKGPQFGIDFTGGKEYVLEFEQPVEVAEIRDALEAPLGGSPSVKLFGSPVDILIRTDAEGEISAVQEDITTAVQQLYPDNPVTIIKTSIVGARFADDLKAAALNAIIFAVIIIFIYILIRFKKWTYSTGAVAALAHDILIVLGVFTIFSGIAPFSMEIDQTLIAALLTILGYSINDTVVVYDRVRERLQTHKTKDFTSLMNKGMNDTLSRTVITGLTTFFSVLVLFIFGGETLKGFSFALMLGIAVGTYSSIFVATSITIDLELKRRKA
ncbi:MAG TPA: protein translocase subunit SecF [Balneolaceae bacterium]|nr:protein translocase subunit SecF [Balneolaceae bacterium]